MLNKLIRRKYFRVMLAQLRGARKLMKRDDPNFVHNTVNGLAEIHLGLEEKDFPKVLVGSHAAQAEIILRHFF